MRLAGTGVAPNGVEAAKVAGEHRQEPARGQKARWLQNAPSCAAARTMATRPGSGLHKAVEEGAGGRDRKVARQRE